MGLSADRRHPRLNAMIVLTVLLGAGVFAEIAGAAAPPANEADFFLDGVAEIGAPGVPGPLCVFGEQAFVVVTGQLNRQAQAPVVAATKWGKGKVVVFGHTGYLSRETLQIADTGRLMQNAVNWAGDARTAAQTDELRIGVLGAPGAAQYLQQTHKRVAKLDGVNWRAALKEVDVLCADGRAYANANDRNLLSAFVKRGGGLVVANLGWGWLQSHQDATLGVDHPGNQLLASAGVVWADGYLDRTTQKGYAINREALALTHAGVALDKLTGSNKGADHKAAAQASETVMLAARTLAPTRDAIWMPRLRRLELRDGRAITPTKKTPVAAKDGLSRVLLALQVQDWRQQNPRLVKAHPAADAFPGSVPPGARTVRRMIQIDAKTPGWHSTGLYAVPGKLIAVAAPPDALKKGLRVRIGCHRDGLWHHDRWSRVPEITNSIAIDRALTLIANPFGGLVYIEAPDRSELGDVKIQIANVIEAPYFVLGQTDLNDWRQRIRKLPGPWAELATDKLIITVPSQAVRQLDDPQALMQFWDRAMDACADLAAIDRKRRRPERLVPDVQISAGYMHAGYPIMTHLDVVPDMVDHQSIIDKKGDGWGFFHEIGHNHQHRDWTFGGSVEVTCNLFTLYVFETVCGQTQPRDGLYGEARMKKLNAYLKNGADFNQWKGDPFLALLMYMQLQEEFGWDAYKKVFAEYAALPRGDRPGNDPQKHDQWMVRFSRTVGRDLGPFFQAWGVPTSAPARQSIADLPDWMPADWPN